MTWVWFPTPTWWLTTICICSSRRFDILFWPSQAPGTHMLCRHTMQQSTHTHKINKIITHTYIKKKNDWEGLCVVAHTCIPKTRRLRQEDGEVCWPPWTDTPLLSTAFFKGQLWSSNETMSMKLKISDLHASGTVQNDLQKWPHSAEGAN